MLFFAVGTCSYVVQLAHTCFFFAVGTCSYVVQLAHTWCFLQLVHARVLCSWRIHVVFCSWYMLLCCAVSAYMMFFCSWYMLLCCAVSAYMMFFAVGTCSYVVQLAHTWCFLQLVHALMLCSWRIHDVFCSWYMLVCFVQLAHTWCFCSWYMLVCCAVSAYMMFFAVGTCSCVVQLAHTWCFLQLVHARVLCS